MSKLKVGLVLDDSLDKVDGVQQYVLIMGNWLVSQGHEVHYLVGQTVRTDLPNLHSLSRNVNVRYNGNRMSMPLPASKTELETLLRREDFDIIHVQMPYSPFLAKRIIELAGERTAVFGTFHIAPFSLQVKLANKALGQWLRKSLKRFDEVVSVSSAAAKFAQDTFGLTTAILPNVIEYDRFLDAKPYALPHHDGPVILFLGRLVPRKGCMILLEAIHLLLRRDPNAKFSVVICGKGPLDAALKRYAKQHGLQDKVTFAGFVSEEDKPKYLKSTDIAVFPSTGGESFGIVLIEAMAGGKAIVLGADNAGYTSVLEPHAELLFPASDADALASKLQVFMADPNAGKRAREWQRDYVKQFDVERVGPQLVKRYQEALRSKRNVR